MNLNLTKPELEQLAFLALVQSEILHKVWWEQGVFVPLELDSIPTVINSEDTKQYCLNALTTLEKVQRQLDVPREEVPR